MNESVSTRNTAENTNEDAGPEFARKNLRFTGMLPGLLAESDSGVQRPFSDTNQVQKSQNSTRSHRRLFREGQFSCNESENSKGEVKPDLLSPSVLYNDLLQMGASETALEAIVRNEHWSDSASDSGDEAGAGEQPDRKKVSHESNLRQSSLQTANFSKADENTKGPISQPFGAKFSSPASRQIASCELSNSSERPQSGTLLDLEYSAKNRTSPSIESEGLHSK